MDEEISGWVPVKSGVLQGTVLGPVLFLSFINDLQAAVKSKVRLFADNCVMCHEVSSDSDCIHLQDDLNRLEEWGMQMVYAIQCHEMQLNPNHQKVKQTTIPVHPSQLYVSLTL